MGSQISTLFYAVQSTFKSILGDYNALSKRISLSPGIPQLNASIPFWTFPNASISRYGEDRELPHYADVIIIGSGISGASIAKALLEHKPQDAESHPSAPFKVVMLEARDACSGATGRNGGHACPNVYNEYSQLKSEHGAAAALEILRFRLAHIDTLIAVAKEENLLVASQARVVEDYDAFMNPELFTHAKLQLEKFLREVPKDLAELFEVIEGRESLNELQLTSSVLGCIMKPGASIHPYRFVTGILSNLISRHSNFELFTRTPCTDIHSDSGAYIVTTPRGEIRALHVVHATNAWSSHLLPGMRRKIIPSREYMTAQRPGQGLMPTTRGPCATNNATQPKPKPWAGSRAFVFYPTTHEFAFDYLTQLIPSSESNPLPTAGEFMYGGGAMLGGRSELAFIDNIGIADDSETEFQIDAYLAGSLERYFAEHWGEEGNEPDTKAGSPPGREWGKGRIKAVWAGIIGVSADFQPWVGRVPKLVSGRKEPSPAATPASGEGAHEKFAHYSSPGNLLAAPGEWISAGFTGEGMVHAWLTGKAVARMVLGNTDTDPDSDDLELPAPFLITEKRVKRAKVGKFMSI